MLKHHQVSTSLLKVLQLHLERTINHAEKLNSFLTSRDISPIRYSMITPWDEAAERTKRFHTGKARHVVIAALEEIAPQCADILLDSVQSCKKRMRHRFYAGGCTCRVL